MEAKTEPRNVGLSAELWRIGATEKSMGSKWFEVVVTATKICVVEVPDEWEPERDRQELAEEYAVDEAFNSVASKAADTANTLFLETPEDVATAKRHADEVFGAP